MAAPKKPAQSKPESPKPPTPAAPAVAAPPKPENVEVKGKVVPITNPNDLSKLDVSGMKPADVLKAIQEGMAMGIAMAAKQQPVAAAPGKRLGKKGAKKCPICSQTGNACGGEHRKAIVWPKDPAFEQWFKGVKVNGVRYDSGQAGREIMVPAKANVEYLVNEWERNEREQAQGKKVTHNSGLISQNNISGFQPYTGRGFRG